MTADDRQLRLVHLQPRPPVRRARRRRRRAPQRRDHPGRGGASSRRRISSSPPAPAGPRTPARREAILRAAAPARSDARRLPRPPGDRAALRRDGRPGARARARQGDRRSTTTAAASSPACPRTFSLAATTRSQRRRCPTCFEVSATAADGEVMAVRHRSCPSTAYSSTPNRCSPRSAATSPRTSSRHDPGRARTPARRQDLSRVESRDVMDSIMAGEATPAQIGGFLVALRAEGRDARTRSPAARRRCARTSIMVRPKRDDLVDTAGTGGDGGKTFNISTAAALVAAAAGAGVAKHGNRAGLVDRDAPTCSRRSASSSTSPPSGSRTRSTRSASASCSRRRTIRR